MANVRAGLNKFILQRELIIFIIIIITKICEYFIIILLPCQLKIHELTIMVFSICRFINQFSRQNVHQKKLHFTIKEHFLLTFICIVCLKLL